MPCRAFSSAQSGPGRPSRGSLNDHHTCHSHPTVVGAVERITASLLRYEVHVLLLARLEHELGSLRVQHLGVLELDSLEKGGRGELVQVVAAILHVQPVGSADTKRELARLEAVVDGDDAHDLRVCLFHEKASTEKDGGECGRDHRSLHRRILPRRDCLRCRREWWSACAKDDGGRSRARTCDPGLVSVDGGMVTDGADTIHAVTY